MIDNPKALRIKAAKRTPMLTFGPFSLETEILAFTFSRSQVFR